MWLNFLSSYLNRKNSRVPEASHRRQRGFIVRPKKTSALPLVPVITHWKYSTIHGCINLLVVSTLHQLLILFRVCILETLRGKYIIKNNFFYLIWTSISVFVMFLVSVRIFNKNTKLSAVCVLVIIFLSCQQGCFLKEWLINQPGDKVTTWWKFPLITDHKVVFFF